MQPGDKEIVLEKTEGYPVDNSTFYTSPRQKRKKPFATNHANTIHSTLQQKQQQQQQTNVNVNFAIPDTKSPGEATDGLDSMTAEKSAQKQQEESPKTSPDKEVIQPVALDPKDLETDLDFGSMVEVMDNPADCQYGVIRWIGYLRDKNKPIAGLEMVSLGLELD